MSYAFNLYFKQLSDGDSPLGFMNDVIKVIYANAKEIVVDATYYIPSLSKIHSSDERTKYITNGYWLYKLFTFDFIYWQEENLVALSGYQYPDAVKNLFDTQFGFQNSTDQDYDLELWNDKIDVFKRNKETINSDPNEESTKTALYEKIFCELCLDEWLYDKKCDTFQRISLCALDSEEKWNDMRYFLQKVVKELEKEQ